MSKKLLCFMGSEQSGKSTAVQNLLKEGYLELALAGKIRELTWRYLRWKPLNHDEYEKFKLAPVCLNLNNNVIQTASTGRILLEEVGQSLIELDEDIFCKEVFKQMELNKDNNLFCLSDLRKQHEIKYIKNYCENNDIDLEVIFCNYNYSKRNTSNKHISAVLCNYLSQRFTHLQNITNKLDDILAIPPEEFM